MLKRIKMYLQSKLNREEKNINYAELLEFQKNGAAILDVRSKQEYEEGHINGSINIPSYEIRQNIEKVVTEKNKVIVLYCKSGLRSKKASKQLSELGYENIYQLYGGLDEI